MYVWLRQPSHWLMQPIPQNSPVSLVMKWMHSWPQRGCLGEIRLPFSQQTNFFLPLRPSSRVCHEVTLCRAMESQPAHTQTLILLTDRHIYTCKKKANINSPIQTNKAHGIKCALLNEIPEMSQESSIVSVFTISPPSCLNMFDSLPALFKDLQPTWHPIKYLRFNPGRI